MSRGEHSWKNLHAILHMLLPSKCFLVKAIAVMSFEESRSCSARIVVR